MSDQEQVNEEEQSAGLEVEQEKEQETADLKTNPDVEKAMGNGWCQKEEWKGDPNDWVSAKKFNERGEMIGSIRDLKQRIDAKEHEFNARLENQHKLHEASTKALLEDLQSRRKDAILEADVDKAEKLQGQIDTLNVPAAPAAAPAPAPANTSVLEEWNSRNPWIFEENPKAAFAQHQFQKHSSQGKPLDQAISAMENDISKHFPDINHRRNQPTAVENMRSNPNKKIEKKLNWSELTSEELRMHKMMPDAWTGEKGKEAFLQAVSDERKQRSQHE